MPADYVAPLRDMTFALRETAGLADLATLPGFESAEPELVEAVLAEAARLAREVIAPTNRAGDRQGCRLDKGEVRTAEGFRDAYAHFCAGGWNGVPFDPAHGGGGLPWAVAMATQEMVTSANMAFSLCPLLTQGAVEALSVHGTPEQVATYLPKLVAGAWTGTMNLTEPQAGSDVGALKTRAVPVGDGSWRISGTKIFITFGEHDLAENIVHLVLARTPGAPAGTRGISLFIVPKFLVNADGSPGRRNDLRCVSIEHKMGIHGSPTCVMSYGDDGGAIGYLLGQENQGMRCMFTMMNNARLSVGLQGLAIAERAYQQALSYAHERKQGRLPGQSGDIDVPIVRHPDVRRNLMLMRAQIEAMRGLIYMNAAALDRAHRHPSAEERARHLGRAQLLIPLSKAWCTDLGVEIASLGVQIHGGMGFIEETGAAQHMRDARIAPIYEGTNGIQAIDLVLRKISGKGAVDLVALLDEMRVSDADLRSGELVSMRTHLAAAVAAVERATAHLVPLAAASPNEATGGATPYLRMLAVTVGGWVLARQALAALGQEKADSFFTAKVTTARFYAEQVLAQVPGLLPAVMGADDAFGDLDVA